MKCVPQWISDPAWNVVRILATVIWSWSAVFGRDESIKNTVSVIPTGLKCETRNSCCYYYEDGFIKY